MQWPKCQSTRIRKNGRNRQRRQHHICVPCGRQFIKSYDRPNRTA
ncbi:IS1/IS1595 family N-terminal zinc-binding domain-containing protein [Parathermosynechococcus lividus]